MNKHLVLDLVLNSGFVYTKEREYFVKEVMSELLIQGKRVVGLTRTNQETISFCASCYTWEDTWCGRHEKYGVVSFAELRDGGHYPDLRHFPNMTYTDFVNYDYIFSN